MALAKANLIMDKGACSMAGISSDMLKDVYVSNIDSMGVMTNSKSTNDGRMTFYPTRFVARVEFAEPIPQPAPARPLVMPRGVLSS